MKILVIAGRFGISGVPLAQMRMARALAYRHHQVDLIYGMVNKGNTAPSIEGVTIRCFNKPKVSQLLFPLIRYFREHKPNIVFSAGDHLNVIVLLAAIISGAKSKISCSSRVTPFDTYSDVFLSKGFFLKIMSRITMWRANVMTCVSADMVKQYKTIFRNAPHVCVYNIVDDDISRDLMKNSVNDKWLNQKDTPIVIAAGSLVPWKGFNDLVVAMSTVLSHKAARLMILGDGPDREHLLRQVTDNGLTDVVKFVGNVENPLAYFRRADVFVLSSYVEGLPNVLVEAMLCGCTPVATDCPTGPREVLQGGKIGYLVPMGDVRALASAIVEALDNPVPSPQLQSAIKEFREETVIARHFKLLGLTSDGSL